MLDLTGFFEPKDISLTGQKVMDVFERIYESGRQQIQLETGKLLSGTYFYNLTTSKQSYTGKILIVK